MAGLVLDHGPRGKRWNYLRFRRLSTATSVRRRNLLPFFKFAERYHRSLKPAWWLNGVEAGYELWSGGVGMHTQRYSVNLTSKPKPPPEKKPADPNTIGPIPVGHSG